MSHRNAFYIAIGLNLIMLIGFGGYFIHLKGKINTSSDSVNSEFFFQYSIEDLKLPSDMILLPLSGVGARIDSLFRESEAYAILWINARSCSPCTDEALNSFAELTKAYGINNRVILASFYMPRELSSIIKEKGIEIPIFVPESIPVNIFEVYNNISKPVMFILDKDYMIKSAFIPVIGERRLSLMYFQVIAARYFNTRE